MFAQMLAVENAARLAMADIHAEPCPSRRIGTMFRLGSIAAAIVALAGLGAGLAWLS